MRYTGYIGVPYNAIGHITPTSSNKVGEIGLWQNNCVAWIAATPNYIYPEEQMDGASIVKVYHPEAGIIDWGGVYNPVLNSNTVSLVTMAADEIPTHIKITPISTAAEVGTGHPGAEYQNYATMNSEEFGFAFHGASTASDESIVTISLVDVNMLGVLPDAEHPGAMLCSYDPSKAAPLATIRIARGTQWGGLEVDVSAPEYLKGKPLALYFTGAYGTHFRNKAKVEITTSKAVTATFESAAGGSSWGYVAADQGTAEQEGPVITCQNGDRVWFNRTVHDGYSFSGWSSQQISPDQIGTDGTAWYFTMPSNNVTMTPVYTINAKQYNITVHQDHEDTAARYTTIETSPAGSALEGSYVALSHSDVQNATMTGYRIVPETGNEITLGPNASGFTMPSSNVDIYGIFKSKHFILASAVPRAWGTIPSIASVATEGDTVTFNTQLNNNFVELQWLKAQNLDTSAYLNITTSGSGNTKTHSFVMPDADVWVDAQFAMKDSNLQLTLQTVQQTSTNTLINNDGAKISWSYTTDDYTYVNGSIKKTSTLSSIPYGANMSVVVNTTSEYKFDRWIVPSVIQPAQSLTSKALSFTYVPTGSPGSAPVIKAAFIEHALTLDQTKITTTQNEYELEVTGNNCCFDNFGRSFYMYVSRLEWNGSKYIEKDTQLMNKWTSSDGSQMSAWATLPLSDSIIKQNKISICVTAVNTISQAVMISNITLKQPYSTVKYFASDGEWKECVVNYYSQNGWTIVDPYYFDGNSWIPCSHG